jgi:hypothetical protein
MEVLLAGTESRYWQAISDCLNLDLKEADALPWVLASIVDCIYFWKLREERKGECEVSLSQEV